MGDRRLQAFQISDELCDKFGYKKLTKEDKAKIFGLNAAKIYGVDVEAKRKGLPKDAMQQTQQVYRHEGGRRERCLWLGAFRRVSVVLTLPRGVGQV